MLQRVVQMQASMDVSIRLDAQGFCKQGQDRENPRKSQAVYMLAYTSSTFMVQQFLLQHKLEWE